MTKRTAAPVEPTSRIHHHTCAECRYRWRCLQLLDKPASVTTCPVDAAAAVNKTGPFCPLCRAIAEARAVADLRGLQLRVTMRGKKA